MEVTPLETAGILVLTAAFCEWSSAAQDLTGAFVGGDAFGGSSTLPLGSCAGVAGTEVSALPASLSADFADFCVFEVTLGALTGLKGIRGTAGFVCVRVCAPWAACAGMAEDWADGCVESISEGGCEDWGVSVAASDAGAKVEAWDSSGPSVEV